MDFIKNKKHLKIALIISIPLLLIAQYYLFKIGIIRPMIKGTEIKIIKGDYISDIDKYVVKVGEEVTLSKGEYITIPSYSKDPDLKFKVLDNSEIISIKGDNATGIKEGYASVGIMNGSSLLKKATIKVVDPKIESLKLNIDKELKYVGDKASINSQIEVDYKDFKNIEKVKYESSNEDILKIEDGEVKAVGVGSATIYAKAKDKEDKCVYNIQAKVVSINIDSKIQMNVDESIKLDPEITTSPKNLKHPKIQYSLVGAKLPIKRAIRLDKDGTIVGLREGEDDVKITCGNKSKIVTIKVNKESIENKEIQNLDISKEVVGDKLILTLTWDYLKDINDYGVYIRNNTLNEKNFRLVKSISVEGGEEVFTTQIQTTVEFDISNLDSLDLDIYIVGKNSLGVSKPSNIVKVNYVKAATPDSITNLYGQINKETNEVNISWDVINKEGVTYTVYVKDNLGGNDEYVPYADKISFNQCIINMPSSEIDLDVYVVAEYDGKTIQSKVINIK